MDTIRFNFLYIDKYSFGRVWAYPESAIPCNILRYTIDGSTESAVDEEMVIVRKGQMSYVPESYWLSCKALEGIFAFYSIRFITSVFHEGANFLREYHSFLLMMDVGGEIEPYFDNIYKWVRTNKKSKSPHVRGALDILIVSLADTLDLGEPDGMKAEVNGLEYNLEQIRKRMGKSTV